MTHDDDTVDDMDLESAEEKAAGMQDAVSLLVKTDWDLVRRRASTLAVAASEVVARFQQSIGVLASAADKEFERARRSDLAEAAGWLPHSTTPLHLLSEIMEVGEVDVIVERYYKENWRAVRHAFMASIRHLNIDDQAKKTYSQALSIHRAGHYRAVVRLLMPEIERLARDPVYSGALRFSASLFELQDAIKQLPYTETASYRHGVRHLHNMSSHVFRGIGEDLSVLQEVSQNPVPNRHAAIHGLVDYNQAKNSINALVLVDFMFHMISALKWQQVHDTGKAVGPLSTLSAAAELWLSLQYGKESREEALERIRTRAGASDASKPKDDADA